MNRINTLIFVRETTKSRRTNRDANKSLAFIDQI